jgi:predicted signal transduction protein with EAL and GGDEF domain
MYQAKEEGKNNFQFYSEKLNANSLERLTLESSLRHALERKEFRLHYQAKRDIVSGRITGMEALLTLAASGPWHGRANAIHPDGRGNRAHRAHWQVGAQDRLFAKRGLAEARPAAIEHRRQSDRPSSWRTSTCSTMWPQF